MLDRKPPEPPISEKDAEDRIARNQFDIEALLAKADHRFSAGDHRASNSFYSAVLKYVQLNGVPAPIYEEEAKRATAMIEHCRQLFHDHLLNHLDNAGFTKSNRHPRFQKSLEMMLGERDREPVNRAFPQTPLVYYYPDIPYVNFAESSAFEWREKLESRHSEMRAEANKLLEKSADFKPYIGKEEHRAQGDVHAMLENPDWSSFFLLENGSVVHDNIEKCPIVADTINELPLCRIGKRTPSVLLSLLRPRAHIPPHTGMLNCRYICHLPLIIPENCELRVGHSTVSWEEGKLLVFDDTVQHEAWNRGNENRLVLIFDVWVPEITELERQQISALFEAVDTY